jgi:hypothetical protein
MNNSPYLDRPLVPLAVALRSTLAEIETKIATAAPSPRRAAISPPGSPNGQANTQN